MTSIKDFRITKAHLTEVYRVIVIACGVPVVVSAVPQLTGGEFNAWVYLLIAFTAIFASRISIKFPSFNGTITVSDTFIFIALLLWGPAAAIATSAVEAIALTYRMRSKLLRTYLFNIASSSLTTWLAATALSLKYGDVTKISQDLPVFGFVLAMCLLAIVYFVSNMVLTTILQMLKLNGSLWKTWSQYYLWTCITFFAGAALAGIFVKLIVLGGVVAVALVAPIAITSYIAYTSYIKTVDALQASESRFRSSFSYATIGMGLVSPEGNWIQVNPRLSEMLLYTESEFLRSDYSTVIHPDSLERIKTEIGRIVDGSTPAFELEARFVNKEDSDVWVMLGVSAAHVAEGELAYLIFQVQDITSRRKAEDKLWFDAHHDALTGLPNRSAFVSRLTELVEGKVQAEHPLFAVLFLDLDGFKIINDSLGHSAGDELLKGVSQRLLDCIRGNDMVARLGGDEFTVLLVNLQDISQAVIVAERIKNKLTRAFTIDEQEVYIGTSIGIATNDIGYENANEMLRDADAAMYQAKASGKGCYSIFDKEMYANAIRQLHLANDLRRAIDRNEFAVHYQPILTLESGDISGFEALVRWHHPTFGTLSPAEFIPLAEENGIVNEIDQWVMLNACRQMKDWQTLRPDLSNLTISVNISSRQFAQTGLFDTVKNVLMDTGLAPSGLRLEITESAMIKNLRNTATILRELSFLGVKIALDDFGTGYSSLNYLHELPISVLKIDRSFVNRIDSESDVIEILKAIVALATNLKMETTAEGIETEQQFEELRNIGCLSGQGYYISRPVPADEAFEFLTIHEARFVPQANPARSGLRIVRQ